MVHMCHDPGSMYGSRPLVSSDGNGNVAKVGLTKSVGLVFVQVSTWLHHDFYSSLQANVLT